jgi:hypothetical protein
MNTNGLTTCQAHEAELRRTVFGRLFQLGCVSFHIGDKAVH